MLLCPVCKTEYEDGSRRRCVADFTPLEEVVVQKAEDPSLLAGRYRIVREIGAGGMAVVFLAERVHIGDMAAVKVMNRSVAGRPDALAQFEMEARLAAAASHPNVVQIYDYGVNPDGLPYLVMEYIEGPTLADELKSCGTLSLERALEIFQPICSAVTAAHLEGLIHRDLKPSNIILQRLKGGTEVVKVLDFGIATSSTGQSDAAVVGTLGYMSLEQVRGEAIDSRSDIYSLAVIFYEMLTAQLPYQAATSAQLLVAMARETPRSLKSLRPDLPTRVELALFKALSRSPEERPSSALELYSELAEAAVRSRPILVPKSRDDLETLPQAPAITNPHAAVTQWVGEAGTLNLESCIGREHEMQILEQEQSLPILLLSEPGAGRTRLLLEYQNVAEREGAVILPARFYDYGGSQLAPYQVFLDTLRACLLGERLPPITERLDPEALKQPQTAQIADIIHAHTGVILPELAFSTEALAGSTDKWKVFEALVEIYRRIARSSRLIFIFDDLHFADSLSLELIAYIARNRADAHIHIVASALLEEAKTPGRPLREWLLKQVGHSGVREVHLQGIPRDRAGEFLAAVFGQIEIGDAEIDYLWRETLGIPLYLVELLEHLMLAGRIEKQSNGWRAQWLGELQLPPSVNNLVNARLRHYDPETLEIFKYASVIGDAFDFDTLAEVVDTDEDVLEEALEEGVKGWLLKRNGDNYRFQHGFVRRSLYNSMSMSSRRKAHAQVAEVIERREGRRKDRVAGQVAYHYYQASEWQRALEPAFRAAELARKREAFDEAARYYRYAVESYEQLRGVDEELVERMHTGFAEALVHLGKFEEGERVVGRIFEIAGARLDAHLRAWGELLASRLNHFHGNFKRAVELARLGLESVTEAEAGGRKDLELRRRMLQQLGYTLWETGEIEEAIAYMESAVELARSCADPRVAGWALSWLGLMHAFQGNGTLGLSQGERALEMLRSAGDRVSELLAWERLGIICGTLGEMDRAVYYFENGLELARTIGYRVQQSRLLANLGEVYRLTGELNRAEDYYRQALAITRQMEQQDIESNCLQNLGHVAVARGDYREAIELLNAALEMLRKQNRRTYEPEVYCSLGAAYEGLADPERAVECYSRALDLSRELALAEFEWKALYGIALVMRRAGNREAALESVNEALEVIERMRSQLPSGANLKSFDDEKQPVYELSRCLKGT